MNDLDQKPRPSSDGSVPSKPVQSQFQIHRKRDTLSKVISFILTAFISCSIGAGIVGYYSQQEFEKQWLGGYGTGKDAGYQLGYTDGHSDGQAAGYDTGFDSGLTQGKKTGYNEGKSDGYDEGYDQGYLDGLLVGAASTPANSPASSSYVANNTTQSVTVYVTNTGEKYHRAGCSYLKKSSNPMSLSSAKAAGYTPCSRCNPPY